MKFRYLSLLLIFFLLFLLSPFIISADSLKTVQVFNSNSYIGKNSSPLNSFLKYDFLSLLPIIKELNDSKPEYVYPSGQSCGLKLLTDGILVLSAQPSSDSSGNILSPGKEAGIKAGDYLISFNGNKLANTSHLEKLISENREKPIKFELVRNGQVLYTTVYPISSDNINYVLGLWVRDSTAGLGTLTYFTEDKTQFAALGHSVSDADTGETMALKKGELLASSIVSVKKGYEGIPGELVGVFEKPEISLGEITQNNHYGIYGKLSHKEEVPGSEPVPVADIKEIKQGVAQIITTVNGTIPEYFDINIIKISRSKKNDGKNLVIEVTDKKLLELTGGIVQGMSGSPILQNGKLVGAVTHVFVNDPTRGYGIFIDNMLAEAEKIK